jgi:hypothetical protein
MPRTTWGIARLCAQNGRIAGSSQAMQELSKEFLTGAAGVEIRRVDEVSARLAVSLIDLLRFSLL